MDGLGDALLFFPPQPNNPKLRVKSFCALLHHSNDLFYAFAQDHKNQPWKDELCLMKIINHIIIKFNFRININSSGAMLPAGLRGEWVRS